MSAIAQTLDEKLKQWRPETARRVEKLVREIIQLADAETQPPAKLSRHEDPFFADAAVWSGPVPPDSSTQDVDATSITKPSHP